MRRVIALILAFSAFLAVAQAARIRLISDERILQLVIHKSKQERDAQMTHPLERKLSDEELEARVREKAPEILSKVRGEYAKPSFLGMKMLIAVLLGAVAVGVATGKPRPTRLLAGLAGVILLLACIRIPQALREVFEFREVVSAPLFALDLASALSIPLAMLACWVAVAPAVWRKPEPPPVPRAE